MDIGVTAAMRLKDACSLEENLTNLDSALKSRDIALLTKVPIVNAMVFPVVMYGCESWTIKKTEPWRTDAFELWCWRRLPRVPWTAGSNLSILKEISWILIGRTDAEAEAPILWPADSLETTLMLRAGGEEGSRGWDSWLVPPIQGEREQSPGEGEARGSLGRCGPWDRGQRLGATGGPNHSAEAAPGLPARAVEKTRLPVRELKESWVPSLGPDSPWRKKWEPTAVSWPGEAHGQRSLVGCRPWGHREWDAAETT